MLRHGSLCARARPKQIERAWTRQECKGSTYHGSTGEAMAIRADRKVKEERIRRGGPESGGKALRYAPATARAPAGTPPRNKKSKVGIGVCLLHACCEHGGQLLIGKAPPVGEAYPEAVLVPTKPRAAATCTRERLSAQAQAGAGLGGSRANKTPTYPPSRTYMAHALT